MVTPINEANQPRQPDKALDAFNKAAELFPNAVWIKIEEQIYLPEARQPKSNNQEKVLEKELIQARILASRGSTVYLLPEISDSSNIGVKHPDAVVDGYVMEFKTITGGIREIEKRFKESRKKADRVFFKIDSDLTQEAVLRKLIDKIRKSGYSGGMVIAHFTSTGKTYFWDIDHIK
jgi:hypothetical protein